MKIKTEIELFIEACFLKQQYLQKFYETNFQFDKQHFLNWNTSLVSRIGWNVRNYCSFSNQTLTKETIAVYRTYWWPFTLTPVHKDFLDEAKQSDIIECQKIDMSCNDCFFMKRIDQNNGRCNKLDKEVKTYSNYPMGDINLKCFQHRKY